MSEIFSINGRDPVISVLMPAYNSIQYIESAVASILDQSWKDFELLVCDDGSSDGTYDYLTSIKDPRVRLYRNTSNKGIVRTLNFLLENARGNYIARMDADDISVRGRFEKQVAFLEANPTVGVVGSWLLVLGTERVWEYPEEDFDIRIAMLFESPFAHPAVMVRRSVMQPYGLDFQHAEDYELWTRLSESTRFHNLPEALLEYRVHTSQISSLHRMEQHALSEKVLAHSRQIFCSKYGIDIDRLDKAITPDRRVAPSNLIEGLIVEFLESKQEIVRRLGLKLLRDRGREVSWTTSRTIRSLITELVSRLGNKIFMRRF